MNKINKLLTNMLSNLYVRQLRKSQWRDQRLLRNMQFKKLKALIKYAYECVPFYHKLMHSCKIKPEDIRDYKDLRRIPPVSKQDIRGKYKDFIAQGLDVSKLRSSFTSGSTGIPLKICYDDATLSFYTALRRYIFSECGVKPNDRFVTIWGRAQSIVWSKPYAKIFGGFNDILVPAFFEEAKLVNILRKINPDVIYTFPSILMLLANSDVSGICPRLIFTQGETVTRHCRDVIKKAFNLELFDTYGSVEFEFLAFECSQHSGLHMITDASYIEFIDTDGEHVSYGEEGEIIVTGLHNRAMPLIRYRIGDVGIPANEECSCGRTWPLIKKIYGRTDDYLVLPSGRKISYFNFYDSFYRILEKNVFCISQFQIVQENKDRITFKIVKGKNFSPKMLEDIARNVKQFFASYGERMEVVMQVVDGIPMERTGKRAR
ncbi:MAG: AMP-binding protein, partial [Nitrososphaerota archaeon]